jgi:phospholipid/cholesterol/gamma-HCH transport system substrate-binding protein
MVMNNSVFEAILGAGVLGVAAFFLYTGYCSSGSNLSSNYILKARFDKIDGIKAGSDVSISGVKVGAVQNIHLDKTTYQPIISFHIKSNVHIPIDSSAEIISDGFMGGKHINISPGGSEENFVEGDIIDNTQSSISLEQLISKFMFSSSSSSSSSQPVPSSDEKKAN